ncbi:hypothetical protein PAEPH01_2511, partial [Pancytospora epiphaga]
SIAPQRVSAYHWGFSLFTRRYYGNPCLFLLLPLVICLSPGRTLTQCVLFGTSLMPVTFRVRSRPSSHSEPIGPVQESISFLSRRLNRHVSRHISRPSNNLHKKSHFFSKLFLSMSFSHPMSSWLTEHFIGSCPPFLLRNILKPAEFRKFPKLHEKECCSFLITSIGDSSVQYDSYLIRGQIITPYGSVPISQHSINYPIILHSCFDRVSLYIFAFKKSRLEIFAIEFSCCSNWNTSSLKAHRIRLLSGRNFLTRDHSSSIPIYCKFSNLRSSSEYHYNTPSPSNTILNEMSISFLGRTCTLQENMCPICLLIIPTHLTLPTHIDLCHLNFRASIRGSTLHVSHTDSSDSFRNPYNSLIFGLHTVSGPTFLGPHELLVCRTRRRPPISYPLISHSLLIEREYFFFEYTKMISDHASSRLPSLPPVERSIIKAWNKLRIANLSTKDALKLLVVKFNMSHEIIRLCEMLYTKGIVTSADLSEVINAYSLFCSYLQD